MKGHKGLVELYVKHGADLSLKDRVGNNILHYASARGHLEVVKYISSLHRVDINSGGFEKKTPVMLAGQWGHKEVVECLVYHGADLALRNSDYSYILHLTSHGGYVDVVKYVLSQNKVDINTRGWKRWTPVIIAGMKGHKGLVELYVKHGADLSLKDRVGNNILHYASARGHLEVVKYIISLHRVDINSRGQENKTPVMIAGNNGHKEVVECLVKHGADLVLTDRLGDNILLLAVSHLEVVEYILSLGVVNINAKNRKGQFAAMKARAGGRRDVLDLLVSYGALT